MPLPTPTVEIHSTAAVLAPLLVEGRPATGFNFTLFHREKELGRHTLDLSDLPGKPMALNFWTRFCTPYRSDMPELQDFYSGRRRAGAASGHRRRTVYRPGFNTDAGKLLDATGIPYPGGGIDDAQVVYNYRIRATPTAVFIGLEGRLLRVWAGSINRDQLEVMVIAILDED